MVVATLSIACVSAIEQTNPVSWDFLTGFNSRFAVAARQPDLAYCFWQASTIGSSRAHNKAQACSLSRAPITGSLFSP